MNSDQRLLLSVLSAAIRGQKFTEVTKGANWQTVFEIAKAHNIQTLLYPAVKNFSNGEGPDSELLAKWKKEFFLSVSAQVQHIENVARILESFTDAGVSVIVVKGLILRNFYPQKELRTMQDADILVHKKDIDLLNSILVGADYYEDGKNSKHVMYSHETFLPIEVHTSLINKDIFKNASDFEEDFWRNASPIKLFNATVLVPSTEDHLLYLCLHMAEHFLSFGFGLRQLCDLVIFIEAKSNSINWTTFWAKSKELGIKRFICILLVVCNQLFGMDIDQIPDFQKPDVDSQLNFFINTIIEGGEFGQKTTERNIENSFLRYSSNQSTNKSILSFFFPPTKTLREKYSYASRYPILTPVAWIHRFVFNVSSKNFLSKIKIASNINKAPTDLTKLLQWLELK